MSFKQTFHLYTFLKSAAEAPLDPVLTHFSLTNYSAERISVLRTYFVTLSSASDVTLTPRLLLSYC